MDAKDRSIVAQVCLKVSGEVYASIADASQGFQPDLLEVVFKKCWQLHDLTMKAVQAPPPGEPGPFDPGQAPAPPPVVSQPAPQSAPAAQPSQPQPTLSGPPCPVCRTPMVPTKDYPAKKARNLSENKKAPPMWKCPMGSWTPQAGAQGCQGCQFEEVLAG